MQACAIKFWAIVVLAMAGTFAQAQEISPYSRFGMGDITSPDFAASRSLGGLSAAYRSPFNINFANPASYSQLSFVTFEIGVQANNRWLTTQNNSYTAGDGFLDYLALAFPFRKNGTLSVGLVPYSSMRYDLQSNHTDSSGANFTRLYSGRGRTYDLYAGYSHIVFQKDTNYTLLQNLSLGANVAYRFGQMRYGEVLTLADNNTSLSARRNATLRVNDLVVTVGAQYRLCLNCPVTPEDSVALKASLDAAGKTVEKWQPIYITFGAYGGTPSNFNSNVSSVFDRFVVSGSNVTTLDTISSTDGEKIKLKMPAQFGFGAMIGNDVKWNIGLDFKYTLWDGFNGISDNNPLKNSFRVGGGIEYRPNIEGRGFVRRTQYRVGGYYDSGYLDINGQNISEFGMTLGLGIPLRPLNKGFDQVNIGLAAGSRGTTSSGLLQETFVKVSVGILLNSAGADRWFVKRKYD